MADDRATHDVYCLRCRRYMYSVWWRDIFNARAGAPVDTCEVCAGLPTLIVPSDQGGRTDVSELVLPAITLWQPWACLIEIGAKRYETRSRPPPRKLIGQRIAIHA